MTASDTPVAEAILERVRSEILIRRLVDEAGKDKKRESWTKHPAFLVVLTFLLTGVVGSLLTSVWQHFEWKHQQDRRVAEEMTKQRLELMTFATQAVAQSCTAAEDVLWLFAWQWSEKSDVLTLQQTGANWIVESRKWRTSEKVLRARLAADFPRERESLIFEQIINDRRRLGVDIQNLLSIADAARGRSYTPLELADIEKRRSRVLKLIDDTTGSHGRLQHLVKVMLQDLHS